MGGAWSESCYTVFVRKCVGSGSDKWGLVGRDCGVKGWFFKIWEIFLCVFCMLMGII